MRPPSSNNKNKSTSTTFKLALLIMEQYLQDQRNQQMMFEMFMKQQAIQTKLIIDTIQRKNGRLNIDSTQLINNLGKQKNVNETQTNDRNPAATTKKPVPRYWLDYLGQEKKTKRTKASG